MTDTQPPAQPPSAEALSRAEADRLARQAREAKALRENLRRRRQQGQQRDAATPPAGKN